MTGKKKYTVLMDSKWLFQLNWRLFFKICNKKHLSQMDDIQIRGP